MLIIDRSVITDGGAALLNSGDPINITSVKTGSGTYTSSEDIKSRTALKSTQYSYAPSSVTVDGVTRTVNALLSNYDPVTEQAIVTTDYTLTEVGLFATVNGADVLFAIGISYDGSEVAAFTGQNKSEIIVNWDMAVSGTDAITITATGATALATDLNAHVNSEAYSASGVHGLRVVLDDTDLVLQAYVNGDWEEVSGGGLKIGTITLSSDAVTVDDVTSTATVTFTTNSDGTPSVSSSDDNVATASVSGTTVTITGVDTGSATITVSIPATAKYTAVSATISVTASFSSFLSDWLTAGGLNPASYADLDAVLADESAVRKLFTIHDAVDVIVDEVGSIKSSDLTKIFNDNYVAKWVNLRDYALDTLYANSTIAGYMDTADKYFYGEWVITDSTTTPVTWGPKGNVPVMTSNTEPYGTASAYQVFDRSYSTTSASTDFSYKFTNPVCVKKYTCKNTSGADITGGTLQGSNDGSNWTSISTPANNTDYYLYYRVHFSSSTTVAELQFYGREMKVSVPVMTSNTSPYGVVSSSGDYYIYYAWHAFDNDSDTDSGRWSSTPNLVPAWIQYGFEMPAVIKEVVYKDYYNSSVGVTTYKFKILGSDTNDFSLIKYESDEMTYTRTTDKTVNHIHLNNNTPCKYYRLLYITFTGSNYSALYGLNFYGFDYSEYDWDSVKPRHYIYDHGVEPSGTVTGGTKGEHAITLSAVGTATLTIDTTSYTAMGGKAGMRASGTNALKCGSATSNFSATNMPYGNGIDITSVNGSNAVGIAQTSAGTFDAEEVWIA